MLPPCILEAMEGEEWDVFAKDENEMEEEEDGAGIGGGGEYGGS